MARNNRRVDIAIVRSVLDSLPLGVFVLNAEREIRWMNARLVQYMERSEAGSRLTFTVTQRFLIFRSLAGSVPPSRPLRPAVPSMPRSRLKRMEK